MTEHTMATANPEERTLSWDDRVRDVFAIETHVSTWRDNRGLGGSDLNGSGARYGVWWRAFQELGGIPREYLLPRIKVDYVDILSESMRSAEARYREDPETAHRLAQMHWGYYFALGGGLSTVDNSPAVRPQLRAQSILRMQMINDIIEKIAGKEKRSSSVLDFACNWGGMAIDMALRGFGSVTAFDFKPSNIDRAQQLASYMRADSITLDVANVYELPKRYEEGFDIVYNLGLLYHVSDPVRLMEISYRLTRKVAVFDSLAHREPFSGFIQAYVSDQAFQRPGMGEQQIELHPTYRAMIDLIQFVGFRKMVEVVPMIGPDYPQREKDAYFQGLRRTVIAFK